MLEEMCGITSSFLYAQKKPKEISFVIRPTLRNLKCQFIAKSKKIKRKTKNKQKALKKPQEPKESSGEQFKLNQLFTEVKNRGGEKNPSVYLRITVWREKIPAVHRQIRLCTLMFLLYYVPDLYRKLGLFIKTDTGSIKI